MAVDLARALLLMSFVLCTCAGRAIYNMTIYDAGCKVYNAFGPVGTVVTFPGNTVTLAVDFVKSFNTSMYGTIYRVSPNMDVPMSYKSRWTSNGVTSAGVLEKDRNSCYWGFVDAPSDVLFFQVHPSSYAKACNWRPC